MAHRQADGCISSLSRRMISDQGFVPIANSEVVEMVRVAQLCQTGSVDIGVALRDARGALVIAETRAALQLENIAPQHQIRVLQRAANKRFKLNNSDGLFWIGLSRVMSKFLTVPTIRFQVLHVFLVLAHEHPRIVHFAVTAHLTASGRLTNCGRRSRGKLPPAPCYTIVTVSSAVIRCERSHMRGAADLQSVPLISTRSPSERRSADWPEQIRAVLFQRSISRHFRNVEVHLGLST